VLAGNAAAGGDQLQQFLQLAPTKLDLITRTAINGSWFNFFLCGASGFVVLPGTDPSTTSGITVPAGGLNSGEAGCS
jgi:phospholipid/cholesterol/gamma-HCH transport system substrate-binding protein